MAQLEEEIGKRDGVLGGDVLELLLTLADFGEFKQLMLSHKASNTGAVQSLEREYLCVCVKLRAIDVMRRAHIHVVIFELQLWALPSRSTDKARSSRSKKRNSFRANNAIPTYVHTCLRHIFTHSHTVFPAKTAKSCKFITSAMYRLALPRVTAQRIRCFQLIAARPPLFVARLAD